MSDLETNETQTIIKLFMNDKLFGVMLMETEKIMYAKQASDLEHVSYDFILH